MYIANNVRKLIRLLVFNVFITHDIANIIYTFVNIHVTYFNLKYLIKINV